MLNVELTAMKVKMYGKNEDCRSFISQNQMS